MWRMSLPFPKSHVALADHFVCTQEAAGLWADGELFSKELGAAVAAARAQTEPRVHALHFPHSPWWHLLSHHLQDQGTVY